MSDCESDSGGKSHPSSPIDEEEVSILKEVDPSKFTLETISSTLQQITGEMRRMKNTIMELQEERKGKRKKTPEPQSESECKRKKRKQAPSEKEDTDTVDMSQSLLNLLEKDSDQEKEDSLGEEDDPTLDLFAPFSAALEASEERGPPVSESMAAVLKNYGKKLEDSRLKATLAKYRIPENCPTLGVPRTNQEIRSALSSFAKTTDTRLCNTQWTIAHAATALVQCSDLLVQASKTLHKPEQVKDTRAKLTDGIAKLADALALTGHATFDLSLRRRETHRPCLPRDSAGLCAPHVAMTNEWLYPTGAEFHRALKEAKDTQRLSNSFTDRDRRRKAWGHSQGQRYGGQGSGANHFLGRGYQPKHSQWKFQGNGKAWKKGPAKRQ